MLILKSILQSVKINHIKTSQNIYSTRYFYKRVQITRLPSSATKEDLEQLFYGFKYNNIVLVKRKNEDGSLHLYGSVDVDKHQHKKFIDTFDGAVLDGKQIRAEEILPYVPKKSL